MKIGHKYSARLRYRIRCVLSPPMLNSETHQLLYTINTTKYTYNERQLITA